MTELLNAVFEAYKERKDAVNAILLMILVAGGIGGYFWIGTIAGQQKIAEERLKLAELDHQKLNARIEALETETSNVVGQLEKVVDSISKTLARRLSSQQIAAVQQSLTELRVLAATLRTGVSTTSKLSKSYAIKYPAAFEAGIVRFDPARYEMVSSEMTVVLPLLLGVVLGSTGLGVVALWYHGRKDK